MSLRVLGGWFLITCTGLVAPAADPADVSRLAASQARWQQAKESCGGDYSYSVIRSSFTGHRSETVVVVTKNRVVERRLETAAPPQGRTTTEWVETGPEIGTHEGAAEPLTMDGLYAIAKKLVETDVPADCERDMAFDERGLLHHCFVRDRRIADDAPLRGVPPIRLTLGER